MIYSDLSAPHQVSPANQRTGHFEPKVCTKVLVLSKEVRNEALPHLYTHNTYHQYLEAHPRHGMYHDRYPSSDKSYYLSPYLRKAGGLITKAHVHLELSPWVICSIHNNSRFKSLKSLLKYTCRSLNIVSELKSLTCLCT